MLLEAQNNHRKQNEKRRLLWQQNSTDARHTSMETQGSGDIGTGSRTLAGPGGTGAPVALASVGLTWGTEPG